MDPAEASYEWLVRAWRRVRGRRDPSGPEAVQLSEIAGRLERLAAMLFGQPMVAKPANDGVGGVDRDTLVLPREVSPASSAGLNLDVYRYRVAWGAAARELGFEGIVDGRDPSFGWLCTLIAVPATRDHLHAILPGARALTERLQAMLAEVHAADRGTRSRHPLEALALRLLDGVDPAVDAASGAAGPWVRDAVSIAPATPDGALAAARRLHRSMMEIGGRPSNPPPLTLWGQILSRSPQAADEASEEAIDEDPTSARSVVDIERTLRIERVRLGQREDRPLYHMFEKLETAEEYGGESATPDASGSPDHMKEALQEVGLGTVVRTPEAPRNLVRAEVIAEPTGLEVGQGSAVALGAFRYPEWDARRGRYRPDWCTVRELRYLSGDAGADNLAVSNDILRAERRHVDAIRGHLLRTLYRRRVRSRQTEGPEIDVEAMVERHADLAVGRTPPDRLYRAARRTLKEVAVLILLDASWSTDAYLEGRRVLDIELSSLLVVAEAFEGYLEEEVAVASFCSHTRNDVRFGVLKSFTDPWIHLRQIAPSLRPDGYTRIGAAVRHASAVLETARAPQKLLLLLSDGKPTDYDRYEGKHGIQDVRHAVREANERRIHTFGIAVEKEAKLYLARMLGPGHHRILNRPDVLPDVMAEVLLRAASS